MFPNIEFQEYINQHFVPVKFISGADADQFYRYDVNIVPACIVLDHEGNEIIRETGFLTADQFMEKLEEARKKAAHRKQ